MIYPREGIDIHPLPMNFCLMAISRNDICQGLCYSKWVEIQRVYYFPRTMYDFIYKGQTERASYYS